MVAIDYIAIYETLMIISPYSLKISALGELLKMKKYLKEDPF